MTPNTITAAIEEGHYATTGVILSELAFDEEKQTLTVEVDDKVGVNYRIGFKGSPKCNLDFEPVDDVVYNKGLAHPATRNYPDAGIGMTFQEIETQRRRTSLVVTNCMLGRSFTDGPPYKYDEFSEMSKA